MRSSLLLAAALLLSSCAHSRLSPRCRDEASACLRGCPQEPYRLQQHRQFDTMSDRRSNCEVRCESYADQCQRSEKARQQQPSP